MNHIIFSIFAMLLMAEPSMAEKTGNGGGAWVCRNHDQSIRWAVLVDLFEAEKEFYLNIVRTETPPEEQLKQAMARLGVANSKFYEALVPFAELVETHWPTQGDSELAVVDDALFRRTPKRESCLKGKIEYEQVVNYTDDERILVNETLRQALPPTDQAALRAHEPIYKLLRERAGDTNSELTRKMVGYLFSDLDPATYADLFKIVFLPKPGLYGTTDGKYCGYIVRVSKNTRQLSLSTLLNPWAKDKLRCGSNSWYLFKYDPYETSLVITHWEYGGTNLPPRAEMFDDETIKLTFLYPEDIGFPKDEKLLKYFGPE